MAGLSLQTQLMFNLGHQNMILLFDDSGTLGRTYLNFPYAKCLLTS